MRVLGARQAIALDDIAAQHTQATAMRDYNPTLNAMAESKAEMRDILDSAIDHPTTMKRARGNSKRRKPPPIASASVALHNACLERLRALKSQFDTSYEPLLQLFAQHATVAATVAPAAPVPPAAPMPPVAPNVPAAAAPPLPPTPATPDVLQTTRTPASTPRANVADLLSIIGKLPQKYHSKYTRLHTYLAEHPPVVAEGPDGHLVVRGKVIEDSKYTDLVKALYAPSRGSAARTMPNGMTELLTAFNSVDVPKSFISSSRVRERYCTIQAQNDYEDVYDASGFGSQSRPQSGRGQKISTIRNEKRGYERFDPAKKSTVASVPLPVGHTPFTYLHAMEQGEHKPNTHGAKHVSQAGHGYVDSPCFPGRPIKALRMY